MNGWTREDERRYTELHVRRELVLSERRAAVARAVVSAGLANQSATELVDALIQHADAVRDALGPYDSGVREAPSKEQP